MSTMVAERSAFASSAKVTQARAIRSEWTKFHSLRSSKVTLGLAALLTVGLAAIITAVISAQWATHMSPRDKAQFDPAIAPLQGVHLSMLAVGVLGVLLISGEYATGMIRASLTVVPARMPVLRAKLVVLSTVVGVTALVSSFVAFFVGEAILSGNHLNTSVASTHALHTIFGAAVYMLIVAVIGMALGALLRNTAAAISSLAALFFVVPIIFNFLPSSWSDNIGPYLPAQAGEAFWNKPEGAAISSPWVALLVLCAWAAALLVPAFVRLARSDA
ncbi:MAG TPA: ABC transporter permease subunit [Sporichthyaceae bacterium]|jgi:ABC-type transport system involved in multi-copper enzyme maturation permease subunit|nr:ABC transporter permease subunit [Sporichthyaceae bacterium]